MVCTANVGRSPLFAVLLQDHADRRLGRGTLTVGSAGTDARAGDPPAEGSRRVAARWGLSLDQHRATPARFVTLDDVALVVTMTRRHRKVITSHRPELAPRTFALRELLAAIDAIDKEPPAADPRDRIRGVVAAADARRPHSRFRRHLDVPDPVGGDQQVYDALGEEFAAAAERLADALFGPLPGPD